MEGRGRGRAHFLSSLMNQPETNGYHSIGRGKLIENVASEVPKPRGRASLLQTLADAEKFDTRSSSSGYKSEIRSASSGIGSSTHNAETKGGRGRASLLGIQHTSSLGYGSDVSALTSGINMVSVKSSVDEKKFEDVPKNEAEADSNIVEEKSAPVMRHGHAGRPVTARANYLKLDLIDSDRGIYEFEVKFNPAVDDKSRRIRLVNRAFYELGIGVKIFDGGWRIFTPYKVEKDLPTKELDLPDGGKVSVSFAFKRMKQFKECRMILNIIFKRIMGELQLVNFGRSDYNPKMAHKIPKYNLEVWPGCITAIEEYEGGILINCDASHRVLRSTTVHEMIRDIARVQIAGRPANSFESDVANALLGLSVITTYNKKILRIDDIDFKKNPLSTFEKNGKEITFVEYYKTQYNIEIQDTKQPLLVNKAKRKPLGKEKEDLLVLLVPELCSPTGLTDEMRSDFQLMKSVAEFTRLAPQQRDSALQQFVKGIQCNEKAFKILNDWGLTLPATSIDLNARVLEPETVYFGEKRQVTEPSADWGRAASMNPMLSTIDLHDWAIIYTARDSRVANGFMETFQEVANKIKLKVKKPVTIALTSDSAATYCKEIRKFTNLQIVVLIFPTQRDDRYATVKKLCNADLGLPSQVINSRTLQNEKSRRSVVTKIILQMNCKVGGSLWGVLVPFKEDGIMFCGLDVYHEASRSTQSVLALVTSLNKSCTKWTSDTAIHNRGQEISETITQLLRKCMQQWYKVNGDYPKRIVMFRDGVGDGQLKTVRDYEVPQFQRLFAQVSSEYKPDLTYIVVQKRINTRYYTRNNNKFENPPPGTVIDHTITRRDWFDFFLVSQNVRQGTVAPTHYVVVHDSSDMPVDTVQKMTYKMTHLYYNWNGTVRVPAPCQYAHKLAYLVGQHVHAPANENLRNLLYFL